MNLKSLNESFANKYATNLVENWYRGCKGVEFIDNGNWSDPELEYKGKTFNYWDIEDALWSDFLEETGHKDSESGIPSVEEEFNEYVQARCKDYLEDVIGGGYFQKGSDTWTGKDIKEEKMGFPKMPAHNKKLSNANIDSSIDDYVDYDAKLDDDHADVAKFVRRATGKHEAVEKKGACANKKACKGKDCKPMTEDVMDANYRSMLGALNRALLLLETYVDYSEDYTYSKEKDKQILTEAQTAYKELRHYITQ